MLVHFDDFGNILSCQTNQILQKKISSLLFFFVEWMFYEIVQSMHPV